MLKKSQMMRLSYILIAGAGAAPIDQGEGTPTATARAQLFSSKLPQNSYDGVMPDDIEIDYDGKDGGMTMKLTATGKTVKDGGMPGAPEPPRTEFSEELLEFLKDEDFLSALAKQLLPKDYGVLSLEPLWYQTSVAAGINYSVKVKIDGSTDCIDLEIFKSLGGTYTADGLNVEVTCDSDL